MFVLVALVSTLSSTNRVAFKEFRGVVGILAGALFIRSIKRG
jgi:hypothetical protein